MKTKLLLFAPGPSVKLNIACDDQDWEVMFDLFIFLASRGCPKKETPPQNFWLVDRSSAGDIASELLLDQFSNDGLKLRSETGGGLKGVMFPLVAKKCSFSMLMQIFLLHSRIQAAKLISLLKELFDTSENMLFLAKN